MAFAELSGAATTRAVYVLGGAGATNAPVPTVSYATVGASGALSGWTATAALPVGLAFHAAVAATPANSRITALGFLYVLGGSTDSAGQPSATVYRGTLAANGTVSGWAAMTALPVPLHSMGATIFHGELYVAGGATTGNVPVGTVYRARIDSSGALGAWQTEAALPFARAHFGFGTFGGYLYTLAPSTTSRTRTSISAPATSPQPGGRPTSASSRRL